MITLDPWRLVSLLWAARACLGSGDSRLLAEDALRTGGAMLCARLGARLPADSRLRAGAKFSGVWLGARDDLCVGPGAPSQAPSPGSLRLWLIGFLDSNGRRLGSAKLCASTPVVVPRVAAAGWKWLGLELGLG